VIRFLQTADWQLGMRRHFLDEEAQPRFMQARVDAIEAIGRLAAEHACDFVAVCGDVFESNQVDRRTIGRTLEALASVPCPVYLLPGNHDPLDAGSIYRSREFALRKPAHVHVLDTGAPVPVSAGLEIVGVPWTTKRPGRDLVAEAVEHLEPSDDVVRVCIAHGMIDRLSPDRNDPALIHLDVAQRAIEERRIHFLALGDHHSTRRISPRIWYAGTPEATDYDEAEPGQILLVEIEEGGECRVEPHRLGRWRFKRKSFELASIEDIEVLSTWLADLTRKDCTILKLEFRGALNLRARARFDEVIQHAQPLFASVRADDRELVVLPDDLDLSDLGLTGFAQSTVEVLTRRAATDAPARDALALLYRLARTVDA